MSRFFPVRKPVKVRQGDSLSLQLLRFYYCYGVGKEREEKETGDSDEVFAPFRGARHL